MGSLLSLEFVLLFEINLSFYTNIINISAIEKSHGVLHSKRKSNIREDKKFYFKCNSKLQP